MRRSKSWCAALVGILLIVVGVQLCGCASTNTATSTSSPAVETASPDVASTQEISGTYRLETINGAPLPFTVTHEPPGVRVMSGSLTINPDGTCTSNTSLELPSGEASTREVRATWTRDGSTLTISWEGAGTTTGTIGDGTFTMENEGQVLVYRKQT